MVFLFPSFCCCCFEIGVLCCNPGCLRTFSVDQAVLKFRDLPDPASQVLGSKGCVCFFISWTVKNTWFPSHCPKCFVSSYSKRSRNVVLAKAVSFIILVSLRFGLSGSQWLGLSKNARLKDSYLCYSQDCIRKASE